MEINMGNFMGDIETSATSFLSELGVGGAVATVIIALALLLFAFFSYKLFKLGLVITGLVGGATLGTNFVLPIVEKIVGDGVENLSLVVMIICAVIGAVLVLGLKKFAIFACGAFIGYTVGAAINASVAAMLANDMLLELPGSLIVPIILAIACGILAKFVFKFIYVIGTSLCAAVAAISMLITAFIPSIAVAALPIGAVIGIVAIVFQLKRHK